MLRAERSSRPPRTDAIWTRRRRQPRRGSCHRESGGRACFPSKQRGQATRAPAPCQREKSPSLRRQSRHRSRRQGCGGWTSSQRRRKQLVALPAWSMRSHGRRLEARQAGPWPLLIPERRRGRHQNRLLTRKSQLHQARCRWQSLGSSQTATRSGRWCRQKPLLARLWRQDRASHGATREWVRPARKLLQLPQTAALTPVPRSETWLTHPYGSSLRLPTRSRSPRCERSNLAASAAWHCPGEEQQHDQQPQHSASQRLDGGFQRQCRP
jgi:hypothetical protein